MDPKGFKKNPGDDLLWARGVHSKRSPSPGGFGRVGSGGLGLREDFVERLETVKETQGLLLEFFEQGYLEKFKVPYLPAIRAADVTYLNDLSKQVGVLRAKSLIMRFFSFDSFATKTKGFTVSVLKQEINNLNRALGAKVPSGPSSSPNALSIKIPFTCDSCMTEFILVMQTGGPGFDRAILCEACQRN